MIRLRSRCDRIRADHARIVSERWQRLPHDTQAALMIADPELYFAVAAIASSEVTWERFGVR